MDTREKDKIKKIKVRSEGLRDSLSILDSLPISFLKSLEHKVVPTLSSGNFICEKLRENLPHALNLNQEVSLEVTCGDTVRRPSLRLSPPIW